MNPVTITRIPGLRTVQSFRDYIDKLGIDLQIEDSIVQGNASPLAKPLKWNDRVVGNSWCVQPMEGWDGTTTGGVTEPMIRRWRNFGASGAKLIWGGEAMAVRPEGRANPNQLIINEAAARLTRSGPNHAWRTAIRFSTRNLALPATRRFLQTTK